MSELINKIEIKKKIETIITSSIDDDKNQMMEYLNKNKKYFEHSIKHF